MSIRYAHQKKDDNHDAIVARFRAAGCTVHNWGVDGAPDLVCGRAGVTFLVEVKDGSKAASKRRLTPKQEAWHRTWRGSPVWVVESVEGVPVVLSQVMSEGGGAVR